MGKPAVEKPRHHPLNPIGGRERTQGSEPSQYLEEKKVTTIPIVVASEIGTAQTGRTLEAIKSRRTCSTREESVRVLFSSQERGKDDLTAS